MADINNQNFRNLFVNYQNQQAYQKKKYDVNGDGKINSKDKTTLTNEQKNLLKEDNLFDLNNDGTVNISDLFFVSEGVDIDGDNTIGEAEKAFLLKYKSQITTEIFNNLKNDKTTTIDDLLNFENEISKMNANDKKSWKNEINKLENQLITNLKNKKNVTLNDIYAVWDIATQKDLGAKLNNNNTWQAALTGIIAGMTKKLAANMTTADLIGFEEKMAEIQSEISALNTTSKNQKAWETAFKNLENQLITNLKKNTDINGDGQATMDDFNALWTATKDVEDVKLYNGTQMKTVLNDLQKNMKTSINKAKNFKADYDVNNDNVVDVKDIINGDLNNDGTTSLSEKLFMQAEKSNIEKAAKKAITNDNTLTISDLLDFEAEIAKMSDADKKTWKNEIKNLENELINKIKKNTDINGDGSITLEDVNAFIEEYQDLENFKLNNGTNISSVKTAVQNNIAKKLKFSGEFNGLFYQKGKIYSGTYKEDKISTVYSKGVFQYSVEDNNGKDYPKVEDGKIQFNKNGSKRFSVSLKVGDVAVINEDGTVKVTDANGQEKEYDKYGILAEHSVENNLSGLLKNYTAQKRKIDITGNAKFNNADKERLSGNEERLLKNKLLFDMNGDGKLSQEDIDAFVAGDIDGDGTTSDIEKAFIKEYKDDLQKAFNNIKADYKLDNKQYFNGKIADGKMEDGLHYTEGKKTNGEVNKQLYIDGVKSTLTGIHTNGKYYANGKLANGLQENGIHYTNGKKTNGRALDENKDLCLYKNGIKSSGQVAGSEKNEVLVYGEDGKYHHSVRGIWKKSNGDYKRTYIEDPSDPCYEPNKLFFKDGKQEVHFIEIEQGDEIRILDSGKFFITRDGIQYSYNEVGEMTDWKVVDKNIAGKFNPPNIDGVPPTNSTGGTTPTTPTAPTNDTSIDIPAGLEMTAPKTLPAGAVGTIEYISDVIGLTENDINNNYAITKDAAGRITKLESKTGKTTYNISYRTQNNEDEISQISKNVIKDDDSFTKTCSYVDNKLTQEVDVWNINDNKVESTWTKQTTYDGKSDKSDFIKHVKKEYDNPNNKSVYTTTTSTNYSDGIKEKKEVKHAYFTSYDRYCDMSINEATWDANGMLVRAYTWEMDFWGGEGGGTSTTSLSMPILSMGNTKAWELEEPEIDQ